MEIPAASPLSTQVSLEIPILVMASVTEAPKLSAYLSYEELRRLSRFTHQKDRELSAVSHGLKRLYLSRILNADPFELRFRQTALGQPLLEGDKAMNFSISHSGDWGVLAISAQGRIGVDIEAGRHLSAETATEGELLRGRIAKQILTRSEWDNFLLRNCSERLLAYWTQKEAVSKALGLGLSMDLSTIHCHGRLGHDEAVSPFGRFHIISHKLPDQMVLSIATENADELNIFRYDSGKFPL